MGSELDKALDHPDAAVSVCEASGSDHLVWNVRKERMLRIGRTLFFVGGIVLLFVFLADELVLIETEALPTKVIAVIATTLLVWFADSGRSDQEA